MTTKNSLLPLAPCRLCFRFCRRSPIPGAPVSSLVPVLLYISSVVAPPSFFLRSQPPPGSRSARCPFSLLATPRLARAEKSAPLLTSPPSPPHVLTAASAVLLGGLESFVAGTLRRAARAGRPQGARQVPKWARDASFPHTSLQGGDRKPVVYPMPPIIRLHDTSRQCFAVEVDSLTLVSRRCRQTFTPRCLSCFLVFVLLRCA